MSRKVFGISPDETSFERRGFRGGTPQTRARIERVGVSFVTGYHQALETPRPEQLIPALEAIETFYRGFAYEGAAMGLALLDSVLPGARRRLADFLADRGGDHVYIAHVGAGWAMARLPFGHRALLDRLDPLLRWLAYDGYGFHQGFFDWQRAVEPPRQVPRRVRGYARRAFDQGLGRSLWFVDAAEPERILRTLESFPEDRRSDLWGGLGLAATYAGGVGRHDVEVLHRRAAETGYGAELAQGAVFAAVARKRAKNVDDATEMASRILCGLSVDAAAELCDEARRNLPTDRDVPDYEIWRRRIQQRVTSPALAVSA